MAIKTKSTRMESIVVLYDMQTDFFTKSLEVISDTDAHNRLNTKANHIAWLAGSLVAQRFEIAKDFGQEMRQQGHELFKDGKGIQENVTYPTLSQFIDDWKKISPVSRNAFIEITDEKLDSEMDMGGMKMTYYELITFTTYREANCIGQLALWRRLLGYEALKY